MASENWLNKLRPKLKISTIRWSNDVDGSTYKKNKLESFLLGSTDKSANKVFLATGYSGRIWGNNNTSLIEGESVSNITNRSIPIPSPAVGGIPYSSARI